MTVEVTYVPGRGGFALVAESICLLTSCADAGVVLGVWRLVQSGASPSRVLSAVPGGDEAGGADWAVLLLPGSSASGPRLLLRGAVALTVGTGGEARTLHGRPSLTWAEHELAGTCRHIAIELDVQSGSSAPALPLSRGVAAAESLVVVSESSMPAASATPQTSITDRPDATALHSQQTHDPDEPAVSLPPSSQPDDGSTRQYVPVEMVAADPGTGVPAPPAPSAVDDLLADFFGDTIDRSVAEAAGASVEGVAESAPGASAAHGSDAALGNAVLHAPEVAPSAPLLDTPEATGPQAAAEPSRPGRILIDAIRWGEEPPGPVATGSHIATAPDAPVADPARVDEAPFDEARVDDAAVDDTAADDAAADDVAADAAADDDVNVTTRRPVASHRPVDELSVQVPAIDCPVGHPNPPHAVRCRICGESVPYREDTTLRVRPSLGRLRLSTGDVVTLDRDVVLGRSPAAPDRPGPLPHLVRIGADSSDVSRVHLLVQLDGWQVQAVDLSSNGTILEADGSPVEALPSKQPYPIQPGARMLLSDDVWVTYEDLP